MDDNNYHSPEYKAPLNGGQPIDATPNDANVNNSSEIPSPTAKPSIYIPPNNNNQINSLCQIEKSYYETNEPSQNPEAIQQPIIQHKNCCTKCFKRYDDISIYLIRIYLILAIQYIFITSIIFLIIKIDKYGIDIKDNILFAIIGIITIISSIYIHFRILCMKDDQRSSKSLYIYIALYILFIVIFCLLFNSFGMNYIIIILITKTIDFLGLLLYILIFTFKSFICMITPVITSAIAITLIYFWRKINLNITNTIIISVLAIIEIIYIGAISRQCKHYFKTDDYLYAALIMDYLIFYPYALFFYSCFSSNINVKFMKGCFNQDVHIDMIY